MTDGDYISRVHKTLTETVEGFNKSEQEFTRLMTTDKDYRSRVYSTLKESVEGFAKTPDEFDAFVGVKKKSAPIGSASPSPDGTLSLPGYIKYSDRTDPLERLFSNADGTTDAGYAYKTAKLGAFYFSPPGTNTGGHPSDLGDDSRIGVKRKQSDDGTLSLQNRSVNTDADLSPSSPSAQVAAAPSQDAQVQPPAKAVQGGVEPENIEPPKPKSSEKPYGGIVLDVPKLDVNTTSVELALREQDRGKLRKDAYTLLTRGNSAASNAVADILLQKFPDDSYARELKAHQYEVKKDYANAVSEMDRAIEFNLTDPNLYARRADLAAKANQPDKAVKDAEVYTRTVGLPGSDYQKAATLSRMYSIKGDAEKAKYFKYVADGLEFDRQKGIDSQNLIDLSNWFQQKITEGLGVGIIPAEGLVAGVSKISENLPNPLSPDPNYLTEGLPRLASGVIGTAFAALGLTPALATFNAAVSAGDVVGAGEVTQWAMAPVSKILEASGVDESKLNDWKKLGVEVANFVPMVLFMHGYKDVANKFAKREPLNAEELSRLDYALATVTPETVKKVTETLDTYKAEREAAAQVSAVQKSHPEVATYRLGDKLLTKEEIAPAVKEQVEVGITKPDVEVVGDPIEAAKVEEIVNPSDKVKLDVLQIAKGRKVDVSEPTETINKVAQSKTTPEDMKAMSDQHLAEQNGAVEKMQAGEQTDAGKQTVDARVLNLERQRKQQIDHITSDDWAEWRLGKARKAIEAIDEIERIEKDGKIDELLKDEDKFTQLFGQSIGRGDGTTDQIIRGGDLTNPIERNRMRSDLESIIQQNDINEVNKYFDAELLKINQSRSVVEPDKTVKFSDDKSVPKNIKPQLDEKAYGKKTTPEEDAQIPKTEITELPKDLPIPEGVKVYEVDGTHIRNNINSDFVQGSNGYAHPNYVPKNEIWIDKSMPIEEREAVLRHEIEEANLMRDGMGYSEAHDIVKAREEKFRKAQVTPVQPEPTFTETEQGGKVNEKPVEEPGKVVAEPTPQAVAEPAKIPEHVQEAYAQAGTLRFTINALKLQMGLGNKLPQKVLAEIDRAESELRQAENVISEYERSKSTPAVEEKTPAKIEVKKEQTETNETPTANNDYANFLLDRIEGRFNERFPGEKFERNDLVKQWNQTEKDRGVDKANAMLEEIVISYSPESTRSAAYQLLKKDFANRLVQPEPAREAAGDVQPKTPEPNGKEGNEKGREKVLKPEAASPKMGGAAETEPVKPETKSGKAGKDKAVSEQPVTKEVAAKNNIAKIKGADILEKELPAKQPKKGEEIDITELNGEINVQPIEKKPANKSTDSALMTATGKDKDRPIITGIFHDAENGVKVATDGHVMVVIPEKIEGNTRIVDPKTGQEIEGKYPRYEAVIPKYENSAPLDNPVEFSNRLSGLERAKKFTSHTFVPARMKLGETDFYLDPSVANTGVRALLDTGTKRIVVEYGDQPNRAIIFRDADNPKKFALVMPVQRLGGARTTVFEVNPKPVKANPEMLMSQAEFLQHLRDSNNYPVMDELWERVRTGDYKKLISDALEFKTSKTKNNQYVTKSELRDAINTGQLSPEKAIEIIRSAGLDVPPDILKMSETSITEPAPTKLSDNIRTAADKVRSKKVDTDLDGTTAMGFKDDLVWNKAIDAVADALIATADLVQAVERGVELLKDFPKEQVDRFRKEMEDAFRPVMATKEWEQHKATVDARTKAESVVEQFGGIENVPEELADVVEPVRPKPPVEEAQASEEPMQTTRMEDLDTIREDYGMPRPEKTGMDYKQAKAESDKKIKDGYDIQPIIEKTRTDESLNLVEQNLLSDAILSVKEKVNQDPSDANIALLTELMEAKYADNSKHGRELQNIQNQVDPEASHADMMMDFKGRTLDRLTEEQKSFTKSSFEEITELKRQLAEKEAQRKEAQDKLDAEETIKEMRRRSGKARSKSEITKDLDATFAAMKAKWAEANKAKMGRLSATIVPLPYAENLVAIAPEVMKATKLLVELGVTNLKEITSQIKDNFGDDVTEKDIQDIIAGRYNEKTRQRSELATKLRDLRNEAWEISELESLLNDPQPKSEAKKIQRNRKISDTKKRINEIRKQRAREEKLGGLTEAEYANNRKIAELEKKKADLENGISTTTNPASKKQWSAEVENLKKEIAEIRKQKAKEEKLGGLTEAEYNDAKKLAAYKNRMLKEIDRIDNELKSTLPIKPKKTKRVELDAEGQKIRDELIAARQRYQARKMHDQWTARTWAEKAALSTADIINTAKTSMATADASMTLLQNGLLSLTHPVYWAKGFYNAIGDLANEKRYNAWMYDVQNDRRFHISKEAGLSVTNPKDPLLQQAEEMYQGNWIDKIPIIGRPLQIKGKNYLGITSASSRIFSSMGNRIRINMMYDLIDVWEADGRTLYNDPKTYKATAQLINASTGRANYPKSIEHYARTVANILWSPRMYWSQLINLTAPLNPYFLFRNGPEVRARVLKDGAKYVGASIMLLGLFKMLERDDNDIRVETDPRSSDFGKVRIGNMRFGLPGGLTQWVTITTQFFANETKSSATGKITPLGSGFAERNRLDLLGGFFKKKLSPLSSLVYTAITDQTTMGEDPTPGGLAFQYLVPISIQNMIETSGDEGVPVGLTTGVISMTGLPTSVYPPTGWYPTKAVTTKDGKVNALGEDPDNYDKETWGMLSDYKIDVAPPEKSTLKFWDEETQKKIGLDDDQYRNFIKYRGDIIKKGADIVQSKLINKEAYWIDKIKSIKFADGKDVIVDDKKAKELFEKVLVRGAMDRIKSKANTTARVRALGKKAPPKMVQEWMTVVNNEPNMVDEMFEKLRDKMAGK